MKRRKTNPKRIGDFLLKQSNSVIFFYKLVDNTS